MKAIVKRYRFFIIILVINLVMLLVDPGIGIKSFRISRDNLLEMLMILPPIFILLGLLEVWVQRETMIKFMGEKSGLKGIIIAFLLGSATAGPLYAAFPVAGVLLKKGSKFSNIMIFIGAWSTTKIPMLLFEASAMGWKFMLTRFVINIPGIVLIGYLIDLYLSEKDKKWIYEQARLLQ